jgi:hypothetical protein
MDREKDEGNPVIETPTATTMKGMKEHLCDVFDICMASSLLLCSFIFVIVSVVYLFICMDLCVCVCCLFCDIVCEVC